MITRLLLILFVSFLSPSLGAQQRTIVWNVKPTYQSIKPYSPTLYLCQRNGKWGVIHAEGNSILQNKYDFIISPNENIGLFGVSEGMHYRIIGLIYSNGTVVNVDSTYYADTSYPFFSEGKLSVSDSSGRFGFLDTNGKLIVRCRFEEVHPFMEGLASVRNKDRITFYITDRYEDDPKKQVIYSQWNSGKVLFGSSFKNGEAVVGYGGKYRVINNEGYELRPYNGDLRVSTTDHTILGILEEQRVYNTPYQPVYTNFRTVLQDGKYGIEANGEKIVPPTFEAATHVDNNMNSIVRLYGQMGLLKVVEGKISARFLLEGRNATNVPVNKSGKAKPIQCEVLLLDAQKNDARLFINKGDSTLVDVTPLVQSETNKWIYEFAPVIKESDDKIVIGCKLVYGDIELLNENREVSISRPKVEAFSPTVVPQVVVNPVHVQITNPRVLTTQADIKTEMQEVASTISNLSNSEVKIQVSLSVHCIKNEPVSQTFKLTLPAKSSKDVIVSVHVKNDEDASAVIQSNTGEVFESKVKLRIY